MQGTTCQRRYVSCYKQALDEKTRVPPGSGIHDGTETTEDLFSRFKETLGLLCNKHHVQCFPHCPSISIYYQEADTQTYADFSVNKENKPNFKFLHRLRVSFIEILTDAFSGHFLFYSDPLKHILLV